MVDRFVAFTLNTAQTLAVLHAVPSSTKCFGEFTDERDGNRFLGFRDDVGSIFSHEAQGDMAPAWKTKHAVYDLRVLSAQPADGQFVTGGDQFCLVLSFDHTDGEGNDQLPVSWSIPQSSALKPGVISLAPATNSLCPIITIAEKLVRDSGDEPISQAVETGYIAGAKWAAIAEPTHLRHLQALCGTLAYSPDLSIEWYFISNEQEGRTLPLRVASDILLGYGSDTDTNGATGFWGALGQTELPTSQWVLGFCAGAIRVSTPKGF